jgi:tetratricopeptide (TPR) repeat protein
MDRFLDEHKSLGLQLRQPHYSFITAGFRTMRALLDGRFSDAEQLALETFSLGQRWKFQSAEGIFGMQMFMLRREQGRLNEVAPLVEMFVKEHSDSSWKPGLALMYAELGLTDKAKDIFEQFAANEFMDIPQDGVWAASMTFLAEVCTWLGDKCRAEVIHRLLTPYAGYAIIASDGACFGAGSRFLGQLAATMGRWQEAEAHFDQALAMNARMGAKPWLAHTQYHYALMLLARSAAGDNERARALLVDASTIARELGMPTLAARIADAQRETGDAS